MISLQNRGAIAAVESRCKLSHSVYAVQKLFNASTRLVEACLKAIWQKRDDVYFYDIWKETCQKATDNGIELPSDHSRRGSSRANHPPTALSSYILDTTTGSRLSEEDDPMTLYRGKLFAVVDSLLSELDRRFTSNDDLLNAMAPCDPHSTSFMSADSLVLI